MSLPELKGRVYCIISRVKNFADLSQSAKILTAKILIPGSQAFVNGITLYYIAKSGRGLGADATEKRTIRENLTREFF